MPEEPWYEETIQAAARQDKVEVGPTRPVLPHTCPQTVKRSCGAAKPKTTLPSANLLLVHLMHASTVVCKNITKSR